MAPRDFAPTAPKPYDFVPIEPLTPQDRQHPRGHECYHPGTLNGLLEATLIVATPLHIASGDIRLRSDSRTPLVRALTRVNDIPCIPASTLKGVIRTVVESISRSCVRITHARNDQLPPGAAGCKRKESLCLACRMFGSLGFEGHVRFDDALLTEGKPAIARMPALYAPRSRTAAYFPGSTVRGRKFYKHGRTVVNSQTPVEIIRPESQLFMTLRFDNLSPGELGVLLTALGLGEPSLVLKLGGGKPACYGSFLVRIATLRIWDNPQQLYGAYDDAEHSAFEMQPCLEAARDLILKTNLEKLAQIWKYDMGRICPEGNY